MYENFFIRLVRGSGLRGLSSFGEPIKEENNFFILRPLIKFKKEDFEKKVKKEKKKKNQRRKKNRCSQKNLMRVRVIHLERDYHQVSGQKDGKLFLERKN